jgi:hypothetical protein
MADTVLKKSSPLLIAAAWAVVILPTAWGLDYTVKNALKIFQSSPATRSPANQPTR